MAESSNRGFASMDDDKQRDIASQGGKAAHESGNAHEFSSEEARKAGRKGGEAASDPTSQTCAVPMLVLGAHSAPRQATVLPSAESVAIGKMALPRSRSPYVILGNGAQKVARALPVVRSQ